MPEMSKLKFDTKVQDLKYRVLREVARCAFDEKLIECYEKIPKYIIPGPNATVRCCIYKERAIVGERIKNAFGGHAENPNIIEVLDIACDECPVSGYTVSSDICRGCIAHRCEEACPRDAIVFDKNQRAYINKERCVECGACAAVCPYSAIINRRRPCENACKVKAISRDEKTQAATIDNNKCIECGACVYQCPFGAITDKSYILDVIDLIKRSKGNTEFKLYAVIAPSFSGQFLYAKPGQIVTALHLLGFAEVCEAALGADKVAYEEAKELAEKGFLISSCCPAFVSYVEKFFPKLVPFVSQNLSPAATIAKLIKEHDENAKIVFIGPCTAKKDEYRRPELKKYIDSVLTFEELQALIDSRDIIPEEAEETPLDTASYFGRIFARSGGLADAVGEALKERKIENFEFKPISCDGIEACRAALMRKSRNVADFNFIEGMACVGGCIGGAGCLTHGPKDKSQIDRYGKEAFAQTIEDALKGSEFTVGK